jgi:hypothetical protein
MLAVAAALGLGTAVVSILAEPTVADTNDRWSLPAWTPYVAGQRRTDVVQLEIWAADPTKRKVEQVKEPTVPPWRFIGTVFDGSARLAVLEIDQGKRIQRLRPGDALPTGAQLTTISAGEIRYLENEIEQVIKLFSVDKNAAYRPATQK